MWTRTPDSHRVNRFCRPTVRLFTVCAVGSWVDQRDLHPHCGLHRAGCYYYIMINIRKRRSLKGHGRLVHVWGRDVPTPYRKMAAASGIAPDSPRLQRGANLSQLHSRGSPAWTCTTTSRLTDGHAALTSPGNGSSAWNCTKVVRLSGGCSAVELRRIWKNGRAPRCCPGCLPLRRPSGMRFAELRIALRALLSSFQTRRVC